MKNNLFLLLSCAIFFSCQDSTNDMEAAHVISGYDNPAKSNGEGLQFSEFKIIPLKTDSNVVLMGFKNVELMDSLIIINDDKGAYSFNMDGSYNCRYGMKGHGHGEYINLTSMWVDSENSKVNLLDNYKKHIMKYDKDGQLIDVKNVSFMNSGNYLSVKPISKGNLFASECMYMTEDDAYSFIDIKNEKSKVVKSYGMQTEFAAIPLGFHQMCVYNGNPLFLMPFKNEVYGLEGDSARVKYVIDTKMQKKSDDEIHEIHDFSSVSLANCVNDGIFKGFTDIFETSSYIMMPFMNLDYFLIDKKTNQGQLYSYQIDEEITHLPLYGIVNVCDDYLVGVTYANVFHDKTLPQDASKELQELKRVSDEIYDETSPRYVVLLYKLK